jgi:NADH-quinone oxidoreductase subunit A
MENVSHLSAYLFQYFPVVMFIAATLIFAVFTLVISYYLQPRLPNKEKLEPYECGSDPISDARMPFPVRYYIIAMLFVIFDIEVIFLYPWALVFPKIKFLGFIEMMVFIGLFVAGYAYAWRKGALEWD